jgi:anaerobic selenocysteine-containing dehydrogenase
MSKEGNKMAEKDKVCKLTEMIQSLPEKEVSRRGLLKSGAFLGGSALLMSQIEGALGILSSAEASTGGGYPLADAKNVIYTVCLQCHTACPIKVKILDGIAVKIDGNPYSSQNMIPNLAQKASPWKAAKIDAKACPKGQAGIQTLYDPYRIVKVLKRKGPRGSDQWETISFDKAISEIVNGGRLFSHIGEDRHVPGLKDIYKLRDSKASAAMAKDSMAVAKGKMSISDFKSKYSGYLDTLIDPNHPDLGPVNNQLVFQFGRIEHGRKEFAKRWLGGSFGSANFFEHTTICEQSHHIGYNESTRQYKKGKWGKGKHHMKPDSMNSEFIIFFGTGFVEANFGPPNMAEKVTEGLTTRRLKVAVVDPRMSKSAAKAWKWLPVKPGSDAALALAMVRWIIENRRYDAKYLAAANKSAAKAIGEPTWSNATHLVKIEKDGPGKLLRAKDIGEGGDQFVVMKNGRPQAVGSAAVNGDLEYSGTVHGFKVKTAFTLLKEEAFSKSMQEWSDICGIPVNDIVAVAGEFTAHGKKAGAEMYRGPVQHTNGYHNARAIIALNILIGNIDHKGGMMTGGGHWHEDGHKLGKPFNLKKLHPGKLHAFGHRLTREKSKYEESTLFNGYPAKRPWFPFSGNVYQEIIPSAADGYPYPIKALWIHKGTPALSIPGANEQVKALADPNVIPLVISTDILLGDTSVYADYVFPDIAVWERWGSPHTSPDVPGRASKFRQPTVTPMTEVVKVYGEKQHCSMEAVMLAIGEKLGLPGCGKGGFGKGLDFTRAEDWYLKLAANLAWGDKAGQEVPDASRDEMKLFMEARRHMKKTVFNPKRWEKAAGSSNWRKVVYLLNRGGRWEDWKDEFTKPSGFVVHKYGKGMNIYAENVAMQRQSMSGKRFPGTPIYEPATDALGREIKDRRYPLQLITYKDILGGHSRTLPTDYWLSSIMPENYILINTATAAKYGFSDGDRARLISATNDDGKHHLPNRNPREVVGKIKAVEGIRPGVVAVSWHYGHWAYGSNDPVVDGRTIRGDRRRATGLCPNAVMRIDPALGNACMTDPIGASSSFYDTRVKLVKA